MTTRDSGGRGAKGEAMHVTAYIFIEVQHGRGPEIMDEVAKFPGVRSVHAVTGQYDIIVFAEAQDLEHLGQLILGRLQKVRGVSKTVTNMVIGKPGEMLPKAW